MAQKYKVGDRVRIKSIDWYNENKDKNGNIVFSSKVPHFALCVNVRTVFTKDMVKYCGKVVTIENVWTANYSIVEGTHRDYFTDEMIEGLVEEEDLIPKFGEYSDNEPLDVPTMTTDFVKEHGLPCPEVYIFKDENGNVINATKIVLEKKKKEYPKTYEECCYITGFENTEMVFEDDYRDINPPKEQWKRLGLMNQFYQLLICRDAYWMIAGEEMGLGKPWKPDYTEESYEQGSPIKYVIYYTGTHITKGQKCTPSYVLTFPTEEMRDAFKENFDPDIEICKELL